MKDFLKGIKNFVLNVLLKFLGSNSKQGGNSSIVVKSDNNGIINQGIIQGDIKNDKNLS